MTDALERVRMMVEGVPDGCQILCDEPEGTTTWSLNVGDLRALCAEVERLRGARSWERWAVVGADGEVHAYPTALTRTMAIAAAYPGERVIRVRITEIPEEWQ